LALSLGEIRGHRTLLKGHRTLNTSVRCSNVSHVSRSCQNLTVTCSAPDAEQVSTGRSGAHRTHAQRAPQTCMFTGREPPDAPSASGAHRTHAQRGSQNARTPDANHRTLNTSVRCSNISHVSRSCQNLTVTCSAPDAEQVSTGRSGAHRTHAQRAPQTRRVTGRKPPDAP
jgi:1,2-phenylacetyl-CoA epoxidase catalytic subunit